MKLFRNNENIPYKIGQKVFFTEKNSFDIIKILIVESITSRKDNKYNNQYIYTCKEIDNNQYSGRFTHDRLATELGVLHLKLII